jgi:high affinity cGMP-specific 3',5'-cyclic phosphodiesterase 9
MQMVHRKGHHRDKRPSMVSEIAGRMRGSYGNILQNNYNSRTTTFGSNRAISLDHYSNHRRMSDGIQTVTSDSTVYYHQRLHDQDILIRQTAGSKMSSSCQGSSDVKLLVSEEPMVAAASTGNNSAISSKIHTPTTMAAATDISDTNRVQSSKNNNNNSNNNNNESSNNKNNNNNSNNNNNNNNLSNSSKSVKSKLSSSVNCSSSPKSIITRLRQLTGRLSFSFDKETRRMSSGAPQTIINKTSPMGSVNSSSKNNNMMPNLCCNTKGAIEGRVVNDVTSRNRAYSLDVPATRYNYNSSAGSSYNGSHKSLSSNRNDEADDSTDNNSVFASKKMSGEVEPMDI